MTALPKYAEAPALQSICIIIYEIEIAMTILSRKPCTGDLPTGMTSANGNDELPLAMVSPRSPNAFTWRSATRQISGTGLPSIARASGQR